MKKNTMPFSPCARVCMHAAILIEENININKLTVSNHEGEGIYHNRGTLHPTGELTKADVKSPG